MPYYDHESPRIIFGLLLISLMEHIDYRTITITGCKCQTIPQLLIEHGLFPTALSQPRIAISMDLIEFYHALFEQSCDIVNAMANALHSFYTFQGFPVVDKDVSTISFT
jgi:hypothetical protein